MRSLVVTLILSSGPVAWAAPQAHLPAEATHVIKTYALGAGAVYGQALTAAQTLDTGLHDFTQKPTTENLARVRELWKRARDAYSLTEAFRFYGGPIDDPKTGPESLLNSWPIDESYIDYVEGNPTAGIIQNRKDFPKITREVLLQLNEKNGEKNISTGYHAIEFLLWGQDTSLESAGQRSVDDYTKNKNAERRKTYLLVLADLLVDELQQVAKGWDLADPNSYGSQFIKGDPRESLRRIFVGVTQLPLDEMSGERMTVALERNDTENEQDCFSDYTLKDLHTNLQGIGRVLTGSFGVGENPAGLYKTLSPAQLKKIKSDFARADAVFSKLETKSFDRIIKAPETDADRKNAREAQKSLEKLAKSLASAGKSFGLTLNVE